MTEDTLKGPHVHPAATSQPANGPNQNQKCQKPCYYHSKATGQRMEALRVLPETMATLI